MVCFTKMELRPLFSAKNVIFVDLDDENIQEKVADIATTSNEF